MKNTSRIAFEALSLAALVALSPAPVSAQPSPRGESVAVVATSATVPPECTAQTFGGHAYYFCHTELDFAAATAYCRAFGTEPASVSSRYENDLLAAAMQSLGRGRHWIGYTDVEREGVFDSVDGSPTSFTAWAVGEPNNLGDEDCAEADPSGIWNDIPCSLTRPNVICEETSACTTEVFRDHLYRFCQRPSGGRAMRAYCAAQGASLAAIDDDAERAFIAGHGAASLSSPPLITAPGDARRCARIDGAGAVTPVACEGVRLASFVCEDPSPCVRRSFDHHTYAFCLQAGATERIAARACRAMGGALASIDSASEEGFIYGNFGVFRRTHFYIGVTDDDSEGRFHGIDGSPLRYTRWSSGEPNNYGSGENCVELADSGWNDVACDTSPLGAFICELP